MHKEVIFEPRWEVNNHSSQPPNLHTIHKEVNLNQKVNQRGNPSALLILLLYL